MPIISIMVTPKARIPLTKVERVPLVLIIFSLITKILCSLKNLIIPSSSRLKNNSKI